MKISATILHCPLFAGIEEKDLDTLLDCLSVTQRSFQKEECIFHTGECTESIGLVISGQVLIVSEDFWGNRAIIGAAGPGELFGEAYACTPGAELSVSAVAGSDCVISLLNVGRLLTTCQHACIFHTRLIRNLLSVLAGKNLMLTQKMSHMSKKTTREKLLSYLSAQSIKKGNAEFDIPFNRQQLADYLSVDRSAMSGELCRMRDEGLLTFDRSHFHLLQQL